MAEVRVSVEGIGRVVARTDAMDRRAKNLSPVFRGKIDKSVTTMFRRQFKTEGAFGGAPWPPLKPASAARKAERHFGGMPLMQRTRRLWGSFIKSGGSEGIRRITRDSYERGSTVPYAAAHQTGGPKGLPMRQIVPDPVPQFLQKTWARVVGEYVLEGDS